MKIKWADRVDYVYINDRRDDATATIDNVEFMGAPVALNLKRDGARVDVYAPAGTTVLEVARVADWVLSNMATLPTGGSFRDRDPDGIEVVDAMTVNP